jgi:hypothetical protein
MSTERIADIREELRLNAEQAATPAPFIMLPVDEVSALLDAYDKRAAAEPEAKDEAVLCSLCARGFMLGDLMCGLTVDGEEDQHVCGICIQSAFETAEMVTR